VKGLPATGQAKCYNDRVGRIACDSDQFPGQDGFHRAGCPSEGRFTDNGDGTVTDACTGLMWQKESADVLGDGGIEGEKVAWQAALRYCEHLTFAGHSGVEFFQDRAYSGYWSSSSLLTDPTLKWGVCFQTGTVIATSHECGGAFVRAVRDAR
jgi:hypothetical protein